MQQLTEEGRRIVEDMAQRHGVSSDAVLNVLYALVAGHGTQAQFSHPDLGGMGQWSQGGMTMVGDMFNNALKYRVDALCSELSGYLFNNTDLFVRARPAQSQSQSQSGGASGTSLFVSGSMMSGNWWPDELGSPSSTGGQNNLRYAFFPSTRRLAIDIGGSVTVYDTLDHQISGFSQQQSGDQSVTFTSQYGLVRVADLPVVAPGRDEPVRYDAHPPMPAAPHQAEHPKPPEATLFAQEATPPAHREVHSPANTAPTGPAAPAQADDIFSKIERLAELHQRGILNQEEFEAKKADLLSRI